MKKTYIAAAAVLLAALVTGLFSLVGNKGSPPSITQTTQDGVGVVNTGGGSVTINR